MGREARCTWTHGAAQDEGTALLESDELVLQGSNRVVVKRKDLARLDVEGDTLTLSHKHGMTRIALGSDRAQDWATHLRAPKGRAEKLGLKDDAAVHVAGVLDRTWEAELEGYGVRRVDAAEADLVLLPLKDRADLVQIERLRAQLKETVALWCIWQRGQSGEAALKEDHLRETARACRLVDVKLVKWSETESAMKLVVPMTHRKGTPARAASTQTRGTNTRPKGGKLSVDMLAPDLRFALDDDMKAKRVFLGLPPAHQRGILVSLNEMKTPDTRARLVARVVAGLHDGSIR